MFKLSTIICLFICLLFSNYQMIQGQTCPINYCYAPPCHISTCDIVKGCSYEPIVCQQTNNACSYDRCEPSIDLCISILNISDSNPCTFDSCGPNGPIHTPISCEDDDDACTVNSCDPIAGCISTPLICNDNSPCTLDTCNSSTGCVFTSNLDDNNRCTIDTCGPNGPIHTPVTCKPKKFLDLLGLGLLCCPQICDSSTGGCIRDPNSPPLPLLLCVD